MNECKVNPTPADAPKCPQCGTPLPAGALAGLCPACLLKQGAADDTVTGEPTRPFNPPSAAELAALFPQLEILELIGKGGMGAVYKARQKQLDRLVALKILPPSIGDDPAFADRFAREAKALAKLNHPGIVTLYEFGVATGGTPAATKLYFFLMEFVDGVNLRQLLRAGRVSPREALAIVPQICDALQFAHDQGIVHRDIKPENILLDRRGRVKVADFGLAKLVATDLFVVPPSGGPNQPKPGPQTLTDAGKIMGTPHYMAPEQIEHPGDVDHRADIYALGVVFYQMLTGELPGKPLQPPSQKVQVDVRLDEVVLRALEKNPERRYQQVSEVKTGVEMLATSEQGRTPMAASDNHRKLTVLLFNPFAHITGPQALFIGLAAILLAGLIGSLSNTHFDGVLDTHTGAPAPSWFFLLEGIVDWLCLGVVLLFFGKLISETPFRIANLLGTQALARWPTIFFSLITLPKAFQRFGNSLVEQFRRGGQIEFNTADAVIFLAVVAAMIPLLCWIVWLMFKSYSASCTLKGGKAVGTFIPAIILAEALSKLVLYWLWKLI
jgi:serine/threonine protein kinase